MDAATTRNELLEKFQTSDLLKIQRNPNHTPRAYNRAQIRLRTKLADGDDKLANPPEGDPVSDLGDDQSGESVSKSEKDQSKVQPKHNVQKAAIEEVLDLVDSEWSRILNLVIHHEKFQAFEGRWRGLQWLGENSLLTPDLRVQVLEVSKQELVADVTQSNIETTETYKKSCTSDFLIWNPIPSL